MAEGIELGRSTSLHQLKALVQQCASGAGELPKDTSLLWNAVKGSSAVDRHLACEAVVMLVRRGKLAVADATHRLVDLIPVAPAACLEDTIASLLRLLQLHATAAHQQAFVCPFSSRTHPLTLIATNRPEATATILMQLELLLSESKSENELIVFAPFFKFIFVAPRSYQERNHVRTELFHLLTRLATRNTSLSNNILSLLLEMIPVMLTDTPDRAAQQLSFLSSLSTSFPTFMAAGPAPAHSILACASELLLGSVTATSSTGLNVPDAALHLMGETVRLHPQFPSLALHAALCATSHIFAHPASPAFHRLVKLVTPILQATDKNFASALHIAVIHAAVSEGVRDDVLAALAAADVTDTTSDGAAAAVVSTPKLAASQAQVTAVTTVSLLAEHVRGREAVYLVALQALFAARDTGADAVVDLLERNTNALGCAAPTSPDTAGVLLLVAVLSLGHSDARVFTAALAFLSALVAALPSIAIQALTHMLFRLKHTSDAERLLALTTTLPALCVDKTCVTAVVGTLVALSQAPRMIAVSLRGLFAVWRLDRRAWPYLQQVLMDKVRIPQDLVEEVQIARAYYMCHVCCEHPDLGKDFVGTLRDIITAGASPAAMSQAIEALVALCDSGVLDTANVWAAIRAPLLADSRPAVLAAALTFAVRLAPAADAVPGDASMHVEDFVSDTKRKELLSLVWSLTSNATPLIASAALESLACFHPSALLYTTAPSAVDPSVLLPSVSASPTSTYINFLATARLSSTEGLVALLRRRLCWEIDSFSRAQRQQWAHGKFREGASGAFEGLRTFISDQYSNSSQPIVHTSMALPLLAIEEEFSSLKPASAQRAMLRRLLDLLGEAGVLVNDWWQIDAATRTWETFLATCYRVFHRARLDAAGPQSSATDGTKPARGTGAAAASAAASASTGSKGASKSATGGKVGETLTKATSTTTTTTAEAAASASISTPTVLARDELVEELRKCLFNGEAGTQANSVRALAALAAGVTGTSDAFGPAWLERVLHTLLLVVTDGKPAASSTTQPLFTPPTPLPEPALAAAAMGVARIATVLVERGTTIALEPLAAALTLHLTTGFADGRSTLHMSCLRALAHLSKLTSDAAPLTMMAECVTTTMTRPTAPTCVIVTAGRTLGLVLEQLFKSQHMDFFRQLWSLSFSFFTTEAAAATPTVEGHIVALVSAVQCALAAQVAVIHDVQALLTRLIANHSKRTLSTSLDVLVELVTRLAANPTTASLLTDDITTPFTLHSIQHQLSADDAHQDEDKHAILLRGLAWMLAVHHAAGSEAVVDPSLWPCLKRSVGTLNSRTGPALAAVLSAVLLQDTAAVAIPTTLTYLPDTSLLRALFEFVHAGCPNALDPVATTAVVLTALTAHEYLPPIDWSAWLLRVCLAHPAAASDSLVFALSLLSSYTTLGPFIRWCAEPVNFLALPLAAQQRFFEQLPAVCLVVGDLSLASFVSACGLRALQTAPTQATVEAESGISQGDSSQGLGQAASTFPLVSPGEETHTATDLRTSAMRGFHGCLKHCSTHAPVVAAVQACLLAFYSQLSLAEMLAADMLSSRAAPFALFTQCLSYLPPADLHATVAVHDAMPPLAVLKAVVVLARVVRFSSCPVVWLEPAVRWLVCTTPSSTTTSERGDEALQCFIAAQLASAFLPTSNSSRTSSAVVEKQVFDFLEILRSYTLSKSLRNTTACLYLLTTVLGAISSPSHWSALVPVIGGIAQPLLPPPLSLSTYFTISPFHTAQTLACMEALAPKIVHFLVTLRTTNSHPVLARLFVSVRHFPGLLTTDFWLQYCS